MSKRNVLSHRDQHRNAAVLAAAGVAALDLQQRGDAFRRTRHAVAVQRRTEQRQSRVAAGTDRTTHRAARAAVMRRTRTRIPFLDALIAGR
jgi:hypothetical protein